MEQWNVEDPPFEEWDIGCIRVSSGNYIIYS